MEYGEGAELDWRKDMDILEIALEIKKVQRD
jgi:hypothetical protein